MLGLPKTPEEIQVLANLLTIQQFGYEVVNLQYIKIGSLSTSSETLKSERFEAGYVYFIQSIVAVEMGTGTPQIKIGILRDPIKFQFRCGTVVAAEDSIDYIGQLLVGEGSQIYADFEVCVAGDTIYLNINGYRLKKP
jgi:hypothetical protein